MAERRMSITSVRPTSAVRLAVHLRLTQVELDLSGKSTSINYVFGAIPGTGRAPDLASGHPKYVWGGEGLGSPVPRPSLRRSGNGRGHFYWEYDGSFVCRHLVFFMYSNEPARAVRRIGNATLRLGRCFPGK